MDTSPHPSTKPQRPNPQARSQTSEHIVPINPRRKFRRRGTGDSAEGKISDDEMQSSVSESEEHELDQVDSDFDVNERSGLATEERRKRLQVKKRRSEAATDAAAYKNGLSKEEQKAADKDVIKKLVTNAILIGLWYFFSLSISIVSGLSRLSVYPTS